MRTLKIENFIAYRAKWDEKDYEAGSWTVIEEYQDREITGIRILLNGKTERYTAGKDLDEGRQRAYELEKGGRDEGFIVEKTMILRELTKV